MFMNKFLWILLVGLCCACSFKKSDEKSPISNPVVEDTPKPVNNNNNQSAKNPDPVNNEIQDDLSSNEIEADEVVENDKPQNVDKPEDDEIPPVNVIVDNDSDDNQSDSSGEGQVVPPVIDLITDSDGDGIIDHLEEGREKYLADIPKFVGEMLHEIKINTTFFQPSINKSITTEFLINTNQKDLVVRSGQNYLQKLVEDHASLAPRTQNHLMLPIEMDQLHIYSAPVVNESALHNFMVHKNELIRTGQRLDSVSFNLRNKIHFKSERFTHFRDLILEVYYYDYQSKKLEFIDFYKNVGSFEFNKDHLLDIPKVETRNTRILDNSVLKSGQFLYVKIKDFYLPQIQKNYSDLLKDVSKKSTLLLVNSPSGIEQYFVGNNGSPIYFRDLVARSLENYEIDENRFIKYRTYPVGEFRHEDQEGNWINILSKWHLATNLINNNPFTYQFLPSDVVFLNYSKSNDPVFITQDVASSFNNTSRGHVLQGEGMIPARTRAMKFIISSLVRLEPIIEESEEEVENCKQYNHAYRACVWGSSFYKKKVIKKKSIALRSNDMMMQDFLKYTSLNVDGFSYPLSRLVSDKHFNLQVGSGGKIILESRSSFLNILKGYGSDMVRFSLNHQRQEKVLEVGRVFERCNCKGACGGPVRDIGCNSIKDRGSLSMSRSIIDYTFFASAFIY
jgi:hypothetical protein